MKISKEFKIGVIVIVALALFYWGFNFLRGKDIFSSERVFLAVYEDVVGLQKSNPISINGLKVGQVRNMQFIPGAEAQVVIEMVIKDPIAIPVNSSAKISSDLLGSKTVEIRLGNSTDYAISGDTLLSEVEISIKEEVNRQLQPIKNKAENLMNSIDTVLSMLQKLFAGTNTDNMTKSVQHLANTFENLESTTGSLDTLISGQKNRLERIFGNIESITYNLTTNEDKLNNIFTNLSSLTDTLAKARIYETMLSVNKTMLNTASIADKINRGEGSMGMLINNDSLYIELEKTSRDLNLLLEDIRLNPKKYVKLSLF